MAKHQQQKPFVEGILTSGEAITIIVSGLAVPFTVWVNPTHGDTISVYSKATENAPQILWVPGAVTEATENVRLGPCHSIVFQRTSGSGSTSGYGISQ